MSLVFADNFSRYGTNTALMLNGVYAEAGGFDFALVNDPDGVSGGHVPRLTNSQASPPTIRYVLPANVSVLGTCCRVWMNNLPTAGNDTPNIITWRNVSNTQLAGLTMDTTGRLTFYDGTNTITTTGPVITANGWYHIEAKYTTSGTGAIEVRVEGLAVISQSGLGYSGHSDVYQVSSYFTGSNFSSTTMYLKDFVIWNSSGSYNNDFLGSVIVYGLDFTSDVQLNWTPSTGSNGWSILDNVPPNDSIYLSAPNPPPSPYIGDMSNLPPDVTSVKGLITWARAAKSDGGDAGLQVSVISGGSTGNGANRPITVAQTYWQDVFELDPHTSAPWLPNAVDLVEVQLNRTA